MLEASAGGPVIDWSLEVEGGNLALIRFVLDIRQQDKRPDEAALNRQLHLMVRLPDRHSVRSRTRNGSLTA